MAWDFCRRLAAHVFSIPLLACSVLLIPPQTAASPQSSDKAIRSTSKPKPKPLAKSQKLRLTPEQKRGLELLKKAKAEAGNLEPAMRAAVLWQVSHGHFKIDMADYKSEMKDALRAAAEAPEDNADLKCFLMPDECHAKPWLEWHILSELAGTFPVEAEELLPQAEPEV